MAKADGDHYGASQSMILARGKGQPKALRSGAVLTNGSGTATMTMLGGGSKDPLTMIDVTMDVYGVADLTAPGAGGEVQFLDNEHRLLAYDWVALKFVLATGAVGDADFAEVSPYFVSMEG